MNPWLHTTAGLHRRCSCCGEFRPWAELEPAGHWQLDDERLELRNCTCGSTLSRVLEPCLTDPESVAAWRAAREPVENTNAA
jgi:hypothetical protein